MTYFKRNNPKYLSSRKFKSYIATQYNASMELDEYNNYFFHILIAILMMIIMMIKIVMMKVFILQKNERQAQIHQEKQKNKRKIKMMNNLKVILKMIYFVCILQNVFVWCYINIKLLSKIELN